jgi:iron-sulfur cluster assembly protein
VIILTPNAIKEVKRLMQQQQKPDLALRLNVKGGGCAGMEYVLDFDTEKKEWDEQFQIDGIRVLVDAKSMLYLDGVTVDYSYDLANGGFKFTNPNAKSSCGCGTSFAV